MIRPGRLGAAVGFALAASAILFAGPTRARAAPSTVAPPTVAVPSPGEELGFEPGADRRLADWSQTVAYLRRLDAASPRVLVEEVGRTTEGRPFLMATFTSEANHARLEAIRAANLRLADPRGLSAAETARLVDEGRTVVALHHGIHSTEVAAPLAALLTAHWLASSDAPEVREVLERCVVLMLPSHNPDGLDRVVEWYRGSLDTPWEGGEIPFLYHRYAGHDNNRDWYAFNLAESRLTVSQVFDRWRPQIVHDLHQMGTRGARAFLPPYTDPYEPNVDPLLVGAVNALGSHVAARLLGEGKTGVVTNALFDAYSPARAYPHTHGGVRILSELASARLASPIEVPFADLERSDGFDPKERAWNFPAPWPGGRWTLRDVLDYQLAANRAVLEHAARHRDFWLRNFTEVLRRAATRTDVGAFVLPGGTEDGHALHRLVEILRVGGVEVFRARTPIRSGESLTFPAGSYVVPMRQPFSAFAKQVLERQTYAPGREGGSARRPYDATAHTLPLLMGVEAVAVPAPFTPASDLEPVGEARPASRRIEGGPGRYVALGHRTGELKALGRLLRAGVAVRWTTEAFTDAGHTFAPGTLLVPRSARGQLAPLVGELGLAARSVDATPRAFALRAPRIGLYQSFVATMDEGWTRFVFERQMDVDYETLRDGDVNRGDLEARFDAIVLPDQAPAQILNGHLPGTLPDEYTGGLGRSGAARLREFVERGGTLVTLDSASLFAVAELGLPVGTPPAPEVNGPGSLLRARVEGTSPLVHGVPPELALWFEASPVLEVAEAAGGPARRGGASGGSPAVALRFAPTDLLASGYLAGESVLAGKPALVEVPLGRGKVVLFAFRPQYRAQSYATYVPFLNALYLSAARAGD